MRTTLKLMSTNLLITSVVLMCFIATQLGAYNTATGDGALLNNELLPIALTFAHVLLSALS